MKRIIIIFALAIATTGFIACNGKEEKKDATEHVGHDHSEGDGHDHDKGDSHDHELAYQCPMDCEKGKTYDAKGKCPVCEMELKQIHTDSHEGHDHEGHDHQGEDHGDHKH
ncbi:MAG: hypothetical protein DI539_05845 [Flavobacterium psychrophilum]|nr:MAG: hypothetical protein DI539_05845 [Flavobacterium psychrophilum]